MTDLNNISKIKQILEVALLTSANPLSLDDLQKLFPEKIERSQAASRDPASSGQALRPCR